MTSECVNWSSHSTGPQQFDEAYRPPLDTIFRAAGKHFLVDTEDIAEAGNEASDVRHLKTSSRPMQFCHSHWIPIYMSCERFRRSAKLPEVENIKVGFRDVKIRPKRR